MFLTAGIFIFHFLFEQKMQVAKRYSLSYTTVHFMEVDKHFFALKLKLVNRCLAIKLH